MIRENLTPDEAIEQVCQYGGKIIGKDVGSIASQVEKAKGIFGKAKQLVQYGKDIMNVLAMLGDYATGSYRQVPWRVIAALAGAVVYVFSPIDVIPDLIPLFGFADDATVFAAVLNLARMDINAYLAWKSSRGEKIEGGTEERACDLPEIDRTSDITNWEAKDFAEVVHAALSSMRGAPIRWFWGSEYIAPYRDNIHQKIMGANGNVDDLLGVIDMEAFEHCNEGFAFTKDRLYFRQFAGHSFSYKWREIITFRREGPRLLINGTALDNICHDEENAERLFKAILAMLNRADLTPEPQPVDETRHRTMGQIAHEVFFTVPKGGCIYVGDNIPEKKRVNAHQSMNVLEPPKAIVVLIDATLFGSATDGVVATNRALYGNGWGSKFRVEWGDLLCIAESGFGNLVARTLNGDYTLYLGGAGSDTQRVICNALNKMLEVKNNEFSRCIDATLAKLRRADIAKAERYLGKTVADFENEEAFIAAGRAKEAEIIEATTVLAKTKRRGENGLACLVNDVPLVGGWKIVGQKVYLDETIQVGENVVLTVKDSELHFGSKSRLELAGGRVAFENCRFVCDRDSNTESSDEGPYMISGKTAGCSMQNCEFDGGGVRPAFVLDGEVYMTKCIIRNHRANRKNSAVLGTPYLKDGRAKIVLRECSFENCMATSQSVIWAMETSVVDCEFIQCSSPNAMIIVVEDSDFDLSNCVFDQCSVANGGAVVSLYSNGGSTMVEGMGVYRCWLKDCRCQYTHNIGIPICSTGGWIDEATYREGVLGVIPFFLRDGRPLRDQIGAIVIPNDDAGGGIGSVAAEKNKKRTCVRKG